MSSSHETKKMLSSLERLKRLKPQPYEKSFKALVVAVGPKITYKNKKGREQTMSFVGLADASTALRAIVYGEDVRENLEEGKSVLVFNFIVRDEYGDISVVLRSNSKVYSTNDIETTDDIRQNAKKMVSGYEQPVQKISSVKHSPVKTKLSVQGRVTQVSFSLFFFNY